MKNITEWITVNGHHVPIYEGESKDEAVGRFTKMMESDRQKSDQIAKNKAEADKKNTSDPPRRLYLNDISASVANKTSDVLHLRTKERFRFKDGTNIRNVYVFAGKGCSKEFRDAEKYAKRWGGKAEDWQHCAGFAKITNGSKVLDREVHWVQGKDGKVREAFIKEHLGNNLEKRK